MGSRMTGGCRSLSGEGHVIGHAMDVMVGQGGEDVNDLRQGRDGVEDDRGVQEFIR